ncbi:hypothetical protein AAFC00_000067 [Neodothiora populina]|uniref:CRAL-TRIO domain-containing protein n=1 Tax=Neodothiora populina TaxID=2781224 RepID=A0ABR3P1M5_9PEZI
MANVADAVPAPVDSVQDSRSSSKPASITSTQKQSPPTPEEYAPKGAVRTPILVPVPTCKPAIIAPLTADQQAKYSQVFATVSNWTTIPSTTDKHATNEPITDNERMFLTRECLLRYLRATKWKVPDALHRLQSTLSWRREYGADTFTADYISPENETGKQVVIGYDVNARPCLYLNPAKQNTKMSDRQIHHLSFMLDRVLDMLPPGQETTCLLINFKGAASGNVPSVAQARAVLNILQNHNPERLGRALISQLPWYVSTFFKLISPFIDPVTKEKMKFNEDLRKYVPPEQLWKESGGDLEFEYDHAKYWPALNAECDKRRAAYKQRWVEAGQKIGEYEEYLRGGDHKPLRDIVVEAEKATAAAEDGTPDIAQLKV